MFDYTLFQWILFFYFYCFFGWCFESAYVSICQKKLINRGFMRGPFLPLYGSGAIMMLVVSKPFERYIPLVYLAGCIGATGLEYVTGVVMEALFAVRYWDYSHKRFNYKGHICLSSTLAWGALTVLVTRYIHPLVERLVLQIPDKLEHVLTLGISVVVSGDFVLSFKAALDLKDILYRLEKVNDEIAHLQKRMDVLLAVAGDEIQERKEVLIDLKDEFIEKKDEIVEKADELKDDVKDSLSELKLKMRLTQEYRERLFRFKDIHKLHLLRNNPLSSKRFKKVLDEIREHLNI
ncbi:MAG: hypothetical protein IJ324_03025 [Lachnospiraceae bacterium]|nr:hypothetical protein [Lachnospiraceae bacterium]